MIPDSLAPGVVIRAPDKTSARESGDEARLELLYMKITRVLPVISLILNDSNKQN